MSKKETNKTTPKPSTPKNPQSDFVPTFKKYKDMTPSEQAIFRQGATTANNSIKERLGLKKEREK